MAIKSLEELRALRNSLLDQVNLREKGESSQTIIELLVGMGTCGIASGARDSFNKLLEIIEKENLNAKVIGVGCAGYCSLEPTIQVNIPGKEPVMYGHMTEDKMQKLIDVVVKNGDFLEEDYLIQSFNKAVL